MSSVSRSGSGEEALVFVGTRLLLKVSGEGPHRLPTVDELVSALGADRLDEARVPEQVVGPRIAEPVFALPEEGETPDGFRLDGLRVAYHVLETRTFRAAGTARQRVQWLRTTRFCTRCGAGTQPSSDHDALSCLACGHLHFPRVAPAVIVLVERDGTALLGRSPHFDEGVYSTLAGFVEPGESLEECVHREIEEEAGVRVRNLRYFGSQPHPFPHSLMVGFVAEWAAGEIRIDEDEIEDARWFPPDDLPELPHPMSIARALIDDFVRRHEPA